MGISRGFLSPEVSSPPVDTPQRTSGLRTVVNRSLLAVRQWNQLTPRHQLQAVCTYRWTVVTLLLLGAAAGGLASLLQTPMYKATAQLFFSPNFATDDVRQLDAGGNYILQRVRSYAEIANSPEVAAAVKNRLGLPYSPEELMSKVSVTGKASSAILNVEVYDPGPERARDIANAIAEELPGFINRVETPTGIDVSPVKVSIIRLATTPSSPESPKPLTDVGIGLFGGLCVGTATAITRYARERAVRDENHAAEVTGLALIGVVGAEPNASSLLGLDGSSSHQERFRQIRTNIRLQAAGKRMTSLTVVGCSAVDGRATVAGELAIAFARAGETVVLVDGNLRAPEIHDLFSLSNNVGLADFLHGNVPVNDIVVQWRPDLSLYVIPAGRIKSSPVERLYQPDRLANLIELFRQDQVFVVVNGPPLLSEAEATFLVSATDTTVVVARTGTTQADHLAAGVGVLRKMPANLLGLIAVRPTR